jgi:hypothetical protein
MLGGSGEGGICWKLQHTQYIISHLDGYGSDRQNVLYYDSDNYSLLLSEFSCQGDSPTPVVYSPELDPISQPRSHILTNVVPSI